MARHKSPRVEKHWNLLEQMQGLIESGFTRHGAAVKVTDKHWKGVSGCKSYEACVQWLQHNYRKHRGELNPGFAIFEEVRAAREKWLSTLSPQERRRAEQRYEEELKRIAPNEPVLPAKVRAARRKTERAAKRKDAQQAEVERARWEESFKSDPQGVIGVLIDELKAELMAELKADLGLRPSYYYDD
jgi:hypothetical protein